MSTKRFRFKIYVQNMFPAKSDKHALQSARLRKPQIPRGSSLARMRSAALEISNTNYHTDLWQEDDGLVVGWELQQFSHPLSLFTCSLRADTWAKCRTNKQLLTRPGHGPKMRLRP
jgi:hypothetical protein